MTQIIDHPTIPPPPPPPLPPMKRAGNWAIGIIAFGGLFAVGAIAVVVAGAASTSADGRSSVFSPKTHTVTYKVGGSTTMASITYENATGDTSQQSDVDVPLTRKSDGGQGLILENMRKGSFLYISAQNSKGSGSVSCSIEVDGVVVESNTSYGGYTIATCSGRL